MKALAIFYIIFCLCYGCTVGQSKYSLTNTKWESKLNKSCIDYLKFGPKNELKDYSCELDYTFSGTYQIFGNTVRIIEIDDSHSEGSNDTLKYIFKISGNKLLPVKAEILKKNNWVTIKNAIDSSYIFIKVK